MAQPARLRSNSVHPNSAGVPFAKFAMRHPVLCIWACWALLLLAAWFTFITHFDTQDPDDYMRLLQVRDLLAGQGWFDVTQHRMNPPYGAAMHWSRLVDIPIAVALAIARIFLEERAASSAAMTIVPLGQLLLVMALEWRLLGALGAGRKLQLAAVALTPLFPLLNTSFAPMRIDHHGWQAICALACGYFLVLTPDRRAAMVGGAIAAIWLSISLEGLPLVAALAAIYGMRFTLFGERSVAAFLAGLSVASWLVHFATRAPATLFTAECDMVSWPHMAAFTLAAILAALAERFALRAGALPRLVALGLAGTMAGSIILAPLGVCAVDPFDALDPVLRDYWYDRIAEGLPITAQPFSALVMLLWVPAIVLYGLHVQRRQRARLGRSRNWQLLGAYALLACLISLFVMRGAINAQILAVPFAALLVAWWLPWARTLEAASLRILATVAVFILATPTLASSVLKPFDRNVGGGSSSAKYPTVSGQACDIASLVSVPKTSVFATLDLGPQILARTRDTVVMSGYHHNLGPMHDVIEAFSGDPVHAEAIVRSYRSAYVLLCLDAGDTEVFRERRSDNLANRLAEGKPPHWLEPVQGFETGSLRLFRVK